MLVFFDVTSCEESEGSLTIDISHIGGGDSLGPIDKDVLEIKGEAVGQVQETDRVCVVFVGLDLEETVRHEYDVSKSQSSRSNPTLFIEKNKKEKP